MGNDQVLNIDKTEETNVLPTFGGVVVIPDSTSTDGIKAETETIWQPKAGTNREELIKAENIIGDKYPMLVGTAQCRRHYAILYASSICRTIYRYRVLCFGR